MGNIYGKIEYGWSRFANNIINACNLFSTNFSKREHSWNFDVFGKMGRIFSSGGERILFSILNNLRGSEINAIFLL